jgi:hypothetical protein
MTGTIGIGILTEKNANYTNLLPPTWQSFGAFVFAPSININEEVKSMLLLV